MGRSVLACAVALGMLAGCQPLYGGKPEKLSGAPKKRRPKKDKEEKEPTIVYVEDCVTDFRGDPTNVRRNLQAAKSEISAGEDALAQSKRAKKGDARISFLRIAIDNYREALIKDPYSAEATVMLAVAYDALLRKGCALKLLARISSLRENEKFRAEANRAADQVADNDEWFRGYRNEAKQAVGR